MIFPFYSAQNVEVEHDICCDRGKKKQRDYTFVHTSLFRSCSLIRGFYCPEYSYHRLYTLICIKSILQLLRSNILFLRRHEDTSSLRLLSDNNSGRRKMSNFSLRQRLHLLFAQLWGDLDERMRHEI